MKHTEEPLLLTPKEVAALLGFTLSTLRRWRARGDGPTYVRCGGALGHVRYHAASVRAWLALTQATEGDPLSIPRSTQPAQRR